MPLKTKLVMVVMYRQELSHVKSFDLLVTWFCELTWQIKYVSPFAEEL